VVCGDTANITCEVRFVWAEATLMSTPDNMLATLTWTRDNVLVPSSRPTRSNKVLALATVGPVGPDDDEAVYRCELRVANIIDGHCRVTVDVACEFVNVYFC